MNYKISFENDASNSSSVTIIFEGDFYIHDIESVRKELLSVISKFESYNIKIDKVDNMDVTFLQLLLSLLNYCKQEKKSIKWDGFDIDKINTIINKVGFNKIITKK